MWKAIVLAAVLGTGCYEGEVRYASPGGPDLVYAAPGVRVIADYDEPIFFAEGAYWWFYEGLWYRSTSYMGGWVFTASPPLVVANIPTPFRFVHYRPTGFIAHHRPFPSHRIHRPYRSPRAERAHRR